MNARHRVRALALSESSEAVLWPIIRLAWATLLALGLWAGMAHAQPEPRNGAEAFIQRSVDRGQDLLSNNRVPANERQRRFRDFLLSLVDSRRIATFTLGRYANRVSPADIDEFTDAFADYVVAVYQDRLSRSRDQTIEVVGAMRDRNGIVVNCDIVERSRRNSQPFQVAFLVRQGRDGRYVIADLNVGGVWQSLTERAEFTAFLDQHRGNIRELTDELRRRARQVEQGS